MFFDEHFAAITSRLDSRNRSILSQAIPLYQKARARLVAGGLGAVNLHLETAITSRLEPRNHAILSQAIPLYQKAGAGLAAGGLGAMVGSPADLSLIRMQADSTRPAERRRNYKSVVDALVRRVPSFWQNMHVFKTLHCKILGATGVLCLLAPLISHHCTPLGETCSVRTSVWAASREPRLWRCPRWQQQGQSSAPGVV